MIPFFRSSASSNRPPEFSQQAHIKSLEEYERIYKESVEQPGQVLGAHRQRVALVQEVGQGPRMELPLGKMVCRRPNQSLLQLPRSPCRRPGARTKPRIIWESEPGEIRTLTYQQLHREVQKFANVLKSLGVKKGDRVAIYMGMTPELPIAMLACARIGAPHTVVFGGFSSNALVDRIHDSQASTVITQDGSYRRGSEVKLFPQSKKR